MDELNYIIANNISTLRTASGMKQSELAEKLNYTDKLISKWERGEAIPNAYTLKQLSEIFGVTIDYIFTDNRNADTAPIPNVNAKVYDSSKRIITAISICGIWLTSLLIFILFWILYRPLPSIFIYTLPVSIITFLILNSVWNKGKHNYYIVAALIASIALTVYTALIKFNCWQIFLLLIPSELIVLLCARLQKK